MASYNERFLELLIRKGAVAEVKDFIMHQKLRAEKQLSNRSDSVLPLMHHSIYSTQLSSCFQALSAIDDELDTLLETIENH